jgi:hypothetical protein
MEIKRFWIFSQAKTDFQYAEESYHAKRTSLLQRNKNIVVKKFFVNCHSCQENIFNSKAIFFQDKMLKQISRSFGCIWGRGPREGRGGEGVGVEILFHISFENISINFSLLSQTKFSRQVD